MAALDDVDWSRYLMGACSSGNALRKAVERNRAQVKELRAENERLRKIEEAVLRWHPNAAAASATDDLFDAVDPLVRATT